ncbi:hypothetical protein CDL15_Pgr023637 [Punica granatum]|uniref:Uncharacterized protein n=1 Tax=Punica granatum TaxID=22663 RepID=A0A218W9B5_PUNGR|nr:hypothetical protein CDL15_Pgr023637 [Punica granatum]
MGTGGGVSMAGFDGGGGAVAGRVAGGGGILTGWIAGTCIAGASTPSGVWFGGSQGFESTVGPYPGGRVEFEEVRFGALSKAMSSAMSAAIWLTVPFNVVMSHSNVTIRAPSMEVDGAWASDNGTGGRIAPECAGGAPAGVGGGGA